MCHQTVAGRQLGALASRVRSVGPRFSGLTVLLVGGTGGMGRVTAARMAEEGASVVVTGAAREEVDAYLAAAGTSAAPAEVLDVCDPRDVARLMDRFDHLDVLVNLAGVGRGAAEYTEEGFERTVDVNLFGSMRTCYAARPLLERARGVHRQHGVGDEFPRFAHGSGLRQQQGSRGAVDEEPGHRSGAGRRTSQRGGARLDRDTYDGLALQ